MRAVAACLLWLVGAGIAADDSIVAVVTQRGGFAAGMAHDHLIALPSGTLEIDFDAERPLATTIALDVGVERLVVDDAAMRARWSERLIELEVVGRELSTIDDGAVTKIRRAMLGKKQLDAESFPRLTASIDALVERESVVGEVRFPYSATVTLGVHGTTSSRPMAARFERDGERIVIEALGEFSFTELGIRPYSAMLGAVRNQDTFFVYARLSIEAKEKR